MGSKSRTEPAAERALAVAARMSGLVEVVTTGPAAASTFGTMMLEVLPERVGPSTSVLRW